MGFKKRHDSGQAFPTGKNPKLTSKQILGDDSSMRKAKDIQHLLKKTSGKMGMRNGRDYNKPEFVVGVGYHYKKGNRVQMDIQGKPVSQFDTGTFLHYKKGEEPHWMIIKNDRTKKNELFHSSDVTLDKRRDDF